MSICILCIKALRVLYQFTVSYIFSDFVLLPFGELKSRKIIVYNSFSFTAHFPAPIMLFKILNIYSSAKKNL